MQFLVMDGYFFLAIYLLYYGTEKVKPEHFRFLSMVEVKQTLDSVSQIHSAGYITGRPNEHAWVNKIVLS